jgi:hypothetical protein
MKCRICGDEKHIEFCLAQRQALCAFCKNGMPAKVGRKEFDRAYWQGRASEVLESIKREFYSDYLSSGETLAEYITHTTFSL